MATFNFPYHTMQVEYPEGQSNLQFGKGWDFGVKPLLPEQRRLTLSFETMRVKVGENGLLDLDWTPALNYGVLITFYEEHRLWKSFDYSCELTGPIKARFASPLKMPKTIKGGTGWTEGFEISLVESRV